MKIEVTVNELLLMGQPLLELIKTTMPGSISYRVSRLAKQLTNEITLAEVAQVTIIQKYGGVQDPKTRGWAIGPDNKDYSKAVKEVGQLMAETVEIDCEPLILPSKINIKPHLLMNLEKFISVDGEK